MKYSHEFKGRISIDTGRTRRGRPPGLLITLTLVTILLLGGCAPQQPPEEQYRGTLTIWTDGDDEEVARTSAKAREFEAGGPGVSVEIIRKTAQELKDGLEAAVSGSGRLPDLAPVPLEPRYVLAGAVQPLDGYLRREEREDHYPGALEGFTFGGRLYGIPYGIEFPFLAINLELFRQSGVAPPPDGKWTYREFADAIRRLTLDRNGDGRPESHGLGFYIAEGFHEFWPFLYSDGGRPLEGDPPRYAMDGPAGVSGLRKLLDLSSSSAVWPGSGRVPPQETWSAFAGSRREIAVLPVGTWAVPLLGSDEWRTDFAVAEFPSGESGTSVTVGRVIGYSVFRQADPRRAEMAVKLAKLLASLGEQRNLARRKGIMPARKSVGNPFPDDPRLARVWEMTSSAVALPPGEAGAAVLVAIQRQVELVLLGAKAPEAGLRDARTEVETIKGVALLGTIVPLQAFPHHRCDPDYPPGADAGGQHWVRLEKE